MASNCIHVSGQFIQINATDNLVKNIMYLPVNSIIIMHNFTSKLSIIK